MPHPPAGHRLRDIELQPVRPQHLDELYRWSTSAEASFRWRFGGATPSPEQFRDSVWGGVLCQFLATDRSGAHHGLAVCYGADHVNGHAYFAVQGNPERPSGGGAMVGLVQLLDHVFTHWPFRKLYADIPEFNMPEFSGALRRYLVTEGRLSDHVFHDGRFWDQLTVALTRDNWYAVVRPRLAMLIPPRGGTQLAS